MWFAFVLLLFVQEPAPAQQDLREVATALYDEGRYAEAAERLEALSASGGPAIARFEAGQMRFAAGHMAHAVRHFQGYIAGGLEAEEQSLARSRLAKAAAGTRVVEVRVEPGAAARTVVARRVGDPAGQERPELETPLAAGAAALRLDPGTWELRVEAPGYVPLRQALTVEGATGPVVMKLVPVAVVAAPGPVGATRAADLRRGRRLTVAGAVVLPLGVVALGGFVATAVAYRKSAAEERRLGFDCNDLAALGDLRVQARRQTGALVGLGVASGALLTAGAVLLVRGKLTTRRARLALDLRPDRAGLLISGSF